ncbi:MAG: HipA domain-containing protein [Allosphingosinicella sp.]
MTFIGQLLLRRLPAHSSIQLVDVTDWARDEDFPVFPVGSKPKRRLISPDSADHPLIPGHTYLFKTSTDWRIQQVWAEYLAYRLGALLGLPVPPSFIAQDRGNGEFGVLVEFFYGYAAQPQATLYSGADILQRLGRNPGADRPHGVATNISVCRRLGLPSPERWWTRLITFDALIGNTDRHTENWGFLMPGPDGERLAMAPIFDNGTSLGYQALDVQLRKGLAEQDVNKYIAGGRHHLGWDQRDDQRASHIQLVERLIRSYQGCEEVMQRVLDFDRGEFRAILSQCVELEAPVPFITQRADWVDSLVEERRSRLRKLSGGDVGALD